jgi:hypothetical protein
MFQCCLICEWIESAIECGDKLGGMEAAITYCLHCCCRYRSFRFVASQQAKARLFAFILFVEHKIGAVLRSDNFAADVKIVLRAINLFSLPCDAVCVLTNHGFWDASVS